MKKIGIFLGGLGALALASSANAAFSECQSIGDPMQRLACYDKAANAAMASAKSPAAKAVGGAALAAVPARLPVKALPPEKPGPRFWFEAEAGIYGFSKNLPVLSVTGSPPTTGPTFVPTSPGFIGLVTMSAVTNPLTVGATPTTGAGGSYKMGYWLNPEQTMAVDGSVFYVQGKTSFSPAPTNVTTRTSINTTPDVFVALFDDSTTTSLSGAGITDRLYGVDANLRLRLPRFASLSSFDVLFGIRDVALDEEFTGSVNTVFSRTYQPALGLAPPTDFTNTQSGSGSVRVWNNFIGPQVGFDAEQHWGRFWVDSENKLAVGATMERTFISSSSVVTTTPTTTLALAGIPIQVNGGAPVTGPGNAPAFAPFTQAGSLKTVFSIVPSGTIKLGYDIDDNLSLTVAYNYIYMSTVERVGDQLASPSSFFAQGITFGVRDKF